MFSPAPNPLIHVILILLPLVQFYSLIKAQDDTERFVQCNTAINYTTGSLYETNLNLTLSYLIANASLNGYVNVTVGQDANTVYGLLQCRGESIDSACESCATTSATEIRQICINQKEAFIFKTNCSIQYSYQHFFSTIDSSPRFVLVNSLNTSNPVLFNRQLGRLLNDVSSAAASSSSRFAVGRIPFKDFLSIYSLQQCTRYITEMDCSNCLRDMISYIPVCCDGKQGGQLYSMSCNFRYEIYSFFQTPLAPPPPSVSQTDFTTNGAPNTNTTTDNGSGKKWTSSKIIFAVVLPATVAALVVLSVCSFLLWRHAKRYSVRKIKNVVPEDDERGSSSLSIGLKTLIMATKNFSDDNKLGQGGFGPVYKGKLADGKEIAVKRLSSTSAQGMTELKTEVMLVAKLLHRNLVKLLGFCLDNEEKLLVYEYLPNGSLDKMLFDQRRKTSLDWGKRYDIILGIARGLLYLHEDSQMRIVHRDLKASNILLDEHMNPKISDFGLAKLFGGSQTHGNTNRIAGTYGYMAPEYVKKGNFSAKSDVYSFGILVLEIVAGQKCSKFGNVVNLQSQAWKQWSNGTAIEILDPDLCGQWHEHEVLKCIHLGLLCVQAAATDRPTMSEIVTMLSGHTMISHVPSKPGFYVSRTTSESDLGGEDSGNYHFDTSTTEPLPPSINEVTMSDFDPR